MPDYPTPDATTSTPSVPSVPNLPDELRPDPGAVARLLAILDTIPREELPDGKARQVLITAIRMGHVDNLYRPHMATYWNISWNDLPAWMDPRQRVTEWEESMRLVTADIQRLERPGGADDE